LAKPEAITHDAPAAPWARPTHDSVPATKAERERLLAAARRYVADEQLVPPLPLDELKGHALRVIARAASEPRFRDFVTVLVSNAAWGETLAGIPFERRLLLLPQCLRDKEHCQAEVDEFGLLCRHCGRCVIHDLQTEAERLGYVVLVAEGTTVVMSLIQEGKIEAVIGVGCLAGLERIFPYTEAAAVPGLAIPLLNDGCAYTSADLDWVWDTLQLTRADRTRRLDLDALRAEVEAWFEPEALAAVLGPAGTETERLAREWLGRAGKRWRPFLALCAYQARRDDPEAPTPADFRKIAVAVECFHKASLVHDDIEDDDLFRYGHPAIHRRFGVSTAINVGDYLIGLGYRLVASQHGQLPADAVADILARLADAHTKLCEGQGAELAWRDARDKRLTASEALRIYALKTAPAFEAALFAGLRLAGPAEAFREPAARFARHLGVAFQILNDLEDWQAEQPNKRMRGTDLLGGRPTVLWALALETLPLAERRQMESLLVEPVPDDVLVRRVGRMFEQAGVYRQAAALVDKYHRRAREVADQVAPPRLRRLLGYLADTVLKR